MRTPKLAEARWRCQRRLHQEAIALTGEIWQEKGFIYIDGKKLDEPYFKPDRRDTGTS